MVVQAQAGRWVVPPTRAIWIVAGMTHEIRCIGEVHMRSLLVARDAAPRLLDGTRAVAISPLLRELIRAAMEVQQPYVPATRDGRVMRLILDELRALPVLPLHLQMPSDPRLLQICGLLRALEQLATGEKVIDVALALGYESPSAFATMFRKQPDTQPVLCRSVTDAFCRTVTATRP
jgi:AraC-like DNA-binding protein